jgi:RNA polymerase sigma factor (sigma-70 family)
VAAVPAEVHGPSDAELIESVRHGQLDAYGSLYERHVSAAHNLARQLSRSSAEADDLVSEAFARVLDTLRAGRGPDSAFRAYLLTSLRHVAYDRTRRERRLELTDDVTTVSGVDTEKISEPFRDTAMAGLERSLAAKAFARLPERWQAVLWHTEIEGQSPAEVAPLLGLTANGVSALAYRAREGLRQAYLQVHLAESTSGRCQATAEKLGAWTRGGLSKRETTQVESHLDECERCQALAAELADVNGGLRVVATLVLGIGAAGYLATTAKATAGVAVAAATTTGAAGGAAGAAGSAPRQFVGVGLSIAALAAALALALTGGTTQSVPTAAVAPAPSRSAPPTRPAPNAPTAPGRPGAPAAPPTKPAPDTQPPAAPPTTPPATTAPPATPAPTSRTPATPPPAPGQPTLTASGPAGGVTIVPGQGPVTLPLTVTNTGDGPSQPVTATLRMPPGVSAVGPGSAPTSTPNGTQAHPISFVRPIRTAAGQGSTTTVACPAGTGTVVCTSPDGLAPGATVVLDFRVEAAAGTSDGTITGTVTSDQGTGVRASVSVRVHVSPPPEVDALSLTAHLNQWDSWFNWLWTGSPVLDVTATNTGTSTKPVTVTVDRPGVVWIASPAATCQGSTAGVTCVTDEPLAPDQSFRLRVRVFHLSPRADTVDVTGTLGTAHASAQVLIRAARCGWALCLPGTGHRGNPGPTTTPAPPTAGTTTTTPPPTTTTTPPTITTPPTTTVPPSTTTTTPGTTTTIPPSPSTTTTTPPSTGQPPPGCPSTPPGQPGQVHPGTPCLSVIAQLFAMLRPL